MYRFLKPLFNVLPLSASRKRFLKDWAYGRLGFLFRDSFGYRAWSKSALGENAASGPARPPAQAPEAAAWDLLALRRQQVLRSRSGRKSKAYVVVPVYGGHDETLTCLFRVLDADPGTDLLVIDDASPVPALAGELERLARSGLFTLTRHASNLGFVASANEGFDWDATRDVVLLNSDTEVFGGWLTRLERSADSGFRIGSLTPLSNNAEIASYPHWLRNNTSALELEPAELDALTARIHAGRRIVVPTGVGFCLYVTRACLDETGGFDLAFGRGYGEENDFCLRARSRGFEHFIAADVFVLHRGGVSFADESESLRARAQSRLSRRHPRYAEEIAAFIARDPLRPIREALDLARLSVDGRDPNASGKIQRSFLFITHRDGGGIERHVRGMAAALEEEGCRVFWMRPVSQGLPSRISLSRIGLGAAPTLDDFTLEDLGGRFPGVLRQLGVDHIHLHSVVGFPDGFIDRFRSFVERAGCDYDVTLHDYTPICPRVHLMGPEERYCGEPEAEGCRKCLRKQGSLFGRPGIEAWRATWQPILEGARLVFCPSRDVRQRMQRYFPDAPLVDRPHPEFGSAARARPRPSRPGAIGATDRDGSRPLRVAIIGAIGPEKGSQVLLACARDAERRRLPIEFIVIGYSDRDDALLQTGRVRIQGAYAEPELAPRIEASDADLAAFFSVLPETYCYVLSAAFEEGLFPVAFDLGAQAERIRDRGWGHLLSPELQDDPGRINDQLLELAEKGWPLPPPSSPPGESSRAPKVLSAYYDLGSSAASSES